MSAPAAKRNLGTFELRISPLWARLLLAGLIAIQILPVLLLTRPAAYSATYWLVNYQDGFVRRGFAGSVLRAVTGGDPSYAQISAAMAVMWIVPLIAVAVLLELLVRAGSREAVLTALLVASSPFLVHQLVYQQRPDQLGIVVLIATAVGLVRAGRPLLVAAGGGLAFAAVAFVHEGIFFYYVPFAMIVAAVTISDRREQIRASGLLFVPPALATAFIGVFGHVSEEQVDAFSRSAPAEVAGSPDIGHFREYMGDTIPTALHHVYDEVGGNAKIIATTGLFTVILVALTWCWLVRWSRVNSIDLARRLRPPVRTATLGFLVASIVVTLAIGADWARWLCIFGTGWLISSAALALCQDRPPRSDDGVVSIPVPAIVLAVAFALLPPIPEQFNRDAVVTWLTFGVYSR